MQRARDRPRHLSPSSFPPLWAAPRNSAGSLKNPGHVCSRAWARQLHRLAAGAACASGGAVSPESKLSPSAGEREKEALAAAVPWHVATGCAVGTLGGGRSDGACKVTLVGHAKLQPPHLACPVDFLDAPYLKHSRRHVERETRGCFKLGRPKIHNNFPS